jgi:hypothetical protein
MLHLHAGLVILIGIVGVAFWLGTAVASIPAVCA